MDGTSARHNPFLWHTSKPQPLAGVLPPSSAAHIRDMDQSFWQLLHACDVKHRNYALALHLAFSRTISMQEQARLVPNPTFLCMSTAKKEK